MTALSPGGFFHFEKERFSLEPFPSIALAVCVDGAVLWAVVII